LGRAVAAFVVVTPPAILVPAARATGTTTRPSSVVGGDEAVHVDDDAVVIAPRTEHADVTPLPDGAGYAILDGVTGYARQSYVIRLAATPEVERLRPSAELAARTISAETGLSVTVAPGQIADRAPADGEIVVRVTSSSPCGTLTSPGISGCGGPRTLGARITRGDVWIAPEVGCDGRVVSTVAHELGHAFGLDHYSSEYQGLRQLMFPTTASGAPDFRAGDRAGLRALAGRPSPLTTEPDGAPAATVAAPAAAHAETAVPRVESAPSAPSYLTRPAQVRVLDTRNGTGLAGAFTPATPRTLDLSPYVGGSATAVALNITTTSAATDGFVTAYPTGTPPPDASSANYARGKDTANLVFVRLGAGARLDLVTGNLDRSVGSVHLVADLMGVFTTDGDDGFVAASPARVYDTRLSDVPGERGFPLSCADIDEFSSSRLTAVGMPASASAAVVNLTVADANGDGFVSLRDLADPTPANVEPATSNVNVANRGTRANLAITPGTDFDVRTSNALAADVIMDVGGYFVDRTTSGAGAFVPVDPTRVLDTRRDLGLSGPFTPGAVRSLAVPVAAGVDPSKVIAVAVNMTVVEAQTGGYLTVAPSGAPLPDASNVNYGAGDAVPNLAVVKVGPGTSIDIMAFAGNPQVIGDLMGYFVRP
jgi:hypothetical protein